MTKKSEYEYSACLYLRISQEDSDKKESNSIQNQKTLLTEYVNKSPNIKLVNVRADVGFSGTNFNRPAFKELMNDIEKGDINCVIVKDMSRLGRNYIETGRYLEQIFPKLNIRFISVNDNYDTLNNDNSNQEDMIAFNNIINDAYAKDISYKTRSSLDIKRKKRELFPTKLPYGYKKEDNLIVVDNEVKQVVIDVFNMKIAGYNQLQIANHLNQNGILSPSAYQKSKKNSDDGAFTLWSSTAIRRILNNEFYIGTLVQGKTQSDIFFHKTKAVEKNEWIKTQNSHESIINKSDFNLVQSLLNKDTRVNLSTQTVNLFSGILVCADCNSNLITNNVSKKDKIYQYFICGTYRNTKTCTSHRISYNMLYEFVKASLEDYIFKFNCLSHIFNDIDVKNINKTRKEEISRKLNIINDDFNKLRKIRDKLNNELAENIINQNDFDQLTTIYDNKINFVNIELEKLNNELKKINQFNDEFSYFVSCLEKNNTIPKLDRKMLLILIDEIKIYGDKKIEIVYKFQLPNKKGVEVYG